MPGLKAAIVPVTPFQQNCTILYEEESKRGVVVDPGGEVERIAAVVAERGIEVERILLTHGHIDHAAGAAPLKATLERSLRPLGAPPVRVPIEGPHEADRFLLDGLEEQGRMFGLPGARSVTPDRWLVEGDTVRIADRDFAVFHCPGHTPGHVVFFSAELRLLIGGDVLFAGSIGRTDFPYGDHDALLAAIRDKLYPLGDDVRVLCGHGPSTTIGRERTTNPFVRG
ncbi:MAG: MBL fold metallo-hydrolase [Geminicoccaceae bacterium]|nr:MBL fold metallo-hydrolase [Geminicoccaceae bacterium]MCX8100485.1 MBL fold metallo-hydrolase [Geminicoccaceae bacterium]